MSTQDEMSNICGDAGESEARTVALLADEISRARRAISRLEEIAKSNPSLGQKYEASLANIWVELDLITNEIHNMDAYSARRRT